jgi:nucleotide-binding universal stress UspA family protein
VWAANGFSQTRGAPVILIAYDGSNDAKAAITEAASLFPGEEAVVATVWQRFIDTMARAGTTIGAPAIVDLDEIDGATEGAAKETAEEGAAQARGLGLDARGGTASVLTTVADAVIHQARDVNARAIVIGTRGLTGLKSIVLGSVSSGVLHHSDRPVVVVPSPAVIEARQKHIAET